MSEVLNHRIPDAGRAKTRVASPAAMVLLGCLQLGWSGLAAQAAEGQDATERSMYFVEKSVEATDLYNEHKLNESLAVLDQLITAYADLDEDGYVAATRADCLQALGRFEEARAAYAVVMQTHPALSSQVALRLREMELARGVDDQLINEFRAAAAMENDEQFFTRVQLARALQKQASVLLQEAVEVFRSADELSGAQQACEHRKVASQTALLAGIHEDLVAFVQEVERTWWTLRTAGQAAEDAEAAEKQGLPNYKASWQTSVSAPAGQVEMSADGATVTVTLDGKPVQLNRTQAVLIRKHQQRINQLIQEAAGLAAPAAEAKAFK